MKKKPRVTDKLMMGAAAFVVSAAVSAQNGSVQDLTSFIWDGGLTQRTSAESKFTVKSHAVLLKTQDKVHHVANIKDGWQGSVVEIGDGVFLTARHVVAEQDPMAALIQALTGQVVPISGGFKALPPEAVEIDTPSGTKKAIRVYVSQTEDLGLVFTKERGTVDMLQDMPDLLPTESVIKIGYRAGFNLNSSEGAVLFTPKSMDKTEAQFQTSLNLVAMRGGGGDSGGALFNEDGKLVGITSIGGQMLDPQGVVTTEGSGRKTSTGQNALLLLEHSEGAMMGFVTSKGIKKFLKEVITPMIVTKKAK